MCQSHLGQECAFATSWYTPLYRVAPTSSNEPTWSSTSTRTDLGRPSKNSVDRPSWVVIRRAATRNRIWNGSPAATGGAGTPRAPTATCGGSWAAGGYLTSDLSGRVKWLCCRGPPSVTPNVHWILETHIQTSTGGSLRIVICRVPSTRSFGCTSHLRAPFSISHGAEPAAGTQGPNGGAPSASE